MGRPIYNESDEFVNEIRSNRVEMLLRDTFDKVEGKTYQEKLDTLNKCECCERHKKNKPSTFSTWIELDFKFKDNTEFNVNCKCDCRHVARHICRQA